MNYSIELVGRKAVKDFIEKHHYSHNINGVMSTYCFGLYDNLSMVGAMLFGSLGMANAWRKYADKPEDVIELRRLVCIDDTPKNTESYFIGGCLRWLKKNTDIKVVVSYADPNYGHQGIVYQASNFTKVGETSPGKVIMWDGKKYHDKTIRTKYKGVLKPFALRVKQALESGEARYEKQVPKIIYLYKLQKS